MTYPTWFPQMAAIIAPTDNAHTWPAPDAWLASTIPAVISIESPGRNRPRITAHSMNTNARTTIQTSAGPAETRGPKVPAAVVTIVSALLDRLQEVGSVGVVTGCASSVVAPALCRDFTTRLPTSRMIGRTDTKTISRKMMSTLSRMNSI